MINFWKSKPLSLLRINLQSLSRNNSQIIEKISNPPSQKTKGFFIITNLAQFWSKTPALFLGLLLTLSFLVGIGILPCLFPLTILILSAPRKGLSCLMTLFILLYAHHFSFPQKTVKGSYVIEMTSVKRGLKRGFLYSAIAEGGLPCYLYSPTWIDPGFSYRVEGTLKPSKSFSFFLKPKGDAEALKKTSSIVEWRYLFKEKIKAYLAPCYPHRAAYFLIASFATGSVDDPSLIKQFERCGLSHLLAISGFNFVLNALFLYYLFRLFLSPKGSSLITLILLSGYFFFLGPSPPILRAYIAISVFLLGRIIERRPSGLNSLGAGLILAFFIDPFSSTNLGFQLSFLATGAIFLIFPWIERLLKDLFPLSDAHSFRHKLVMKAKRFLLQAIALDVAVHVILFPLLLHTFHALALHSLFYNLFFPTLFTPTLFLLPLATLLHFLIPPLGMTLHTLNDLYTHFLLILLDFRPFPHHTLYLSSLSAWVVSLYTTLLFLLSLSSQERRGYMMKN